MNEVTVPRGGSSFTLIYIGDRKDPEPKPSENEAAGTPVSQRFVN